MRLSSFPVIMCGDNKLQRAMALIALIALSGCLTPPDGDERGSGIFGIAMMGPVCPVERNPPDPDCSDKPYEGKLTATHVEGGVAGAFSTDAQGRFNVSLPAGNYMIESSGPNQLPRCSHEEPITVVARSWTRVDVSCDTGIR